MSNRLPTQRQMKHLKHDFKTCKRFRNPFDRYREIATKNKQVYAICCQPGVPDDVIYGEDVDTFGY